MDMSIIVTVIIFGVLNLSALGVMWGKLSQKVEQNTRDVCESKRERAEQIKEVKTMIAGMSEELHNGYTCRSHGELMLKLGQLQGQSNAE